MEPLFLEVDESHATFVHVFYKMMAKKLVLERTLLQISEEAEHLGTWRPEPTKVQKEYAEFINCMVTLRRLLTALNVQSTVVRFNLSRLLAIDFGESMQKFS